MNYQKLYDQFIEDRRQHPTGEIRAEIHHIIPLSSGGDPGEENCIRLCIRDHIFAHKVLYRLGLSPTATKKMSRAVANAMLLHIPTKSVSAYGRDKVSPKNLMKATASKKDALVRLGYETVDKFLEIINPKRPNYLLRINQSKKLDAAILEWFKRMTQRITIIRTPDSPALSQEPALVTPDSPALSQEPALVTPESPAPSQEPAQVTPESPAPTEGNASPAPGCPPKPRVECWPEEKIYITAGGETKLAIIPTPVNWKFLKSFVWHSLVYRCMKPELDKLYAEIEPTGKWPYSSRGGVICRSKTEFNRVRREAEIYGYYMVTRLKPGTYASEQIALRTKDGMYRLLLQHTALYHFKDLTTADVVDVTDKALLGRLEKLVDPSYFMDSSEFDELYSCLARQVLKTTLFTVAGTPARRLELMKDAFEGAYSKRNELRAAYERVRGHGYGEAEVPTWKIVAVFIAKYGLNAVRCRFEGTAKAA